MNNNFSCEFSVIVLVWAYDVLAFIWFYAYAIEKNSTRYASTGAINFGILNENEYITRCARVKSKPDTSNWC